MTDAGGLADLVRAADAIVERAWGTGVAPAAGRSPMVTPRPTLVGVGWATVERDRAEAEISRSLRSSPGDWQEAPRDALLGASARISHPVGRGLVVVLLEPDTEGRLAATLARSGEGVAVAYVMPAAGEVERVALSRPAPTPLGTGRLILGGRAWGPHVVVLGPADAPLDRPTVHGKRDGTIEP